MISHGRRRKSYRTLQTLEQIRLQLVHGPEDPVRFGRFKSRRIIDAPRRSDRGDTGGPRSLRIFRLVSDVDGAVRRRSRLRHGKE